MLLVAEATIHALQPLARVNALASADQQLFNITKFYGVHIDLTESLSECLHPQCVHIALGSPKQV